MKKTIYLVLLIWGMTASARADNDAGQIVRDAFDYMRGGHVHGHHGNGDPPP